MLSIQAMASRALGATMMFESWGYMMPQQDPTAVSYTHLTLPTILRV